MSIFSTVIASLPLLVLQAGAPSYQAEIQRWQRQRETALKADDGWLAVAGLFWLKEGRNSVGAGRTNDIVLPKGSAPETVGVFELRKGATTFCPAPSAALTLNDRPLSGCPLLRTDSAGSPDILHLNDLTLYVIQRGHRFGIRLKDKNSEMRKAFTGLKYFPVREQYRVKARFVPYNPPKEIAVPNILGEVEMELSPGYVEFTLDGQRCRLEPITEGDSLFFIFKDLTSGKETYPSGRFLFTEMPKDGEVILDFNKAVNPPCAFTPYATCPLPPKQNHLPMGIAAGELRYGH